MSTQRELKFRVWDATNGVMTSAPEGYMFPGDCLANDHEGVRPSLFKRRELVFLQYTGLRDKEGREIYEGDIMGGYPHGTAVVRWDDAYACWAVYWMDHNPEWDGEDSSDQMVETSELLCTELDNCKDAWEVIGTIHENPELIPA